MQCTEHHRIAEVVLFLTFKRSDLRSAGRKRILKSNSRSRSFILQSFASRKGVAYHHIILLAVSLKFSKTYPPKSPKNSRRRQPPMSFDAHAQGDPGEHPHKLYIFRNSGHWPTFLSLIVWVYLHSNLCSGLQKTHLCCNRALAENGFWRKPLKVIHFAISYQPTGVACCRLILLALSLKKKPLKSPKIAVVVNLTLIWRPRQEEPPQISPINLTFTETRVIGLHFCRW